jgi:hypothetical protein
MKKTAAILFVVLSMTLAIVLAPTLTWAAEFSYADPPAFTVTYPDGSQPTKTDAPEQVWAIKTPEGVVIQASYTSIPEGVELKDYAEKVYKPGLEAGQKTKAKIKKNEAFDLADGTKGYYSEIEWMWQGSTLITTVMVSAYKGGKLITTTGHPWASPDEPIEIVQSLKFK